MKPRDFHLRIGHLVVHDDGTQSAADLEAAIGQSIRQRLEGVPPAGARRALPGTIADVVLDHPLVSRRLTRDGG